jgi:hypothetical protein
MAGGITCAVGRGGVLAVPPGGVTVGSAVASGTNDTILYIDGSGNLASSAALGFDGTSLTIGGSGPHIVHATAGLLYEGGLAAGASTADHIFDTLNTRVAGYIAEWDNNGAPKMYLGYAGDLRFVTSATIGVLSGDSIIISGGAIKFSTSWISLANNTFAYRYQQTTGTTGTVSAFNDAGANALSATSGLQTVYAFTSAVNQTGTAGYSLYDVYAIETSAGSGTNRVLRIGSGSDGLTNMLEVRATADVGNDETALYVYVKRGSTPTTDRVLTGAADSAGAGYRALCVPN